MKEKIRTKINNRFKQKFKKIILFRNPNEFTSLYIERVNPNHKGIIWGRRHKKFNKGTGYIKVGKIYFEIIPIIVGLTTLGWIDAVTHYANMLLVHSSILIISLASILSILIYYLPFKMETLKWKSLSIQQ